MFIILEGAGPGVKGGRKLVSSEIELSGAADGRAANHLIGEYPRQASKHRPTPAWRRLRREQAGRRPRIEWLKARDSTFGNERRGRGGGWRGGESSALPPVWTTLSTFMAPAVTRTSS
jgi:hypothetical protein